MIIVVIPHVSWVTLDIEVGGIIIAGRLNINTGHRYRLRIANIVNNVQLVVIGFLYLQVINVAVLIQVKVVDLVGGVVNGFFKGLRVGTVFYKLGKLIYVKTGSGIVFDSDIVLLRRVLAACRKTNH